MTSPIHYHNSKKRHLSMNSPSMLFHNNNEMDMNKENNNKIEDGDKSFLASTPNTLLSKKPSIRRSTGLLNLTLDTSPDTERILNNMSSKKDEMLKSFNNLTFDNSLTPSKSNFNDNSGSGNKYTGIFNTSNSFAKYKERFSKPKLSNIPTNSPPSKLQSTKKIKSFTLNKIISSSTPFKNKTNNYHYYNTSDIDFNDEIADEDEDLNNHNILAFSDDEDLILDDSSPSKNAFNKPVIIPQGLENNSVRPITTGSLQHSSSKIQSSNNRTSFISVKPLQTAFNSTGLQSKIGISSNSKRNFKQMPETPMKKPPRMALEYALHSNLNINLGLGLDKKAKSNKLSGSFSAPVTSSTPLINSVNTPFDGSFNESSILTNNDNSQFTKNLNSNLTETTTSYEYQKANNVFNSTAINTSDLQQCLLKFTNELDDEDQNHHNAVNSRSIFMDQTSSNYKSNEYKKLKLDSAKTDDSDFKMWSEEDKVPSNNDPATPNLKENSPRNIFSNSIKKLIKRSPESLNSELSNDTPTKSGNFNFLKKRKDDLNQEESKGPACESAGTSNSYWARANSRNASVQSLLTNNNVNNNGSSLPVFAPPSFPLSLNTDFNDPMSSINNSPRTPVEYPFSLSKNTKRDSTSSMTSINKSKVFMSTPAENKFFAEKNDTFDNLKNLDAKASPPVDKKNHDENLTLQFGNCKVIGMGEFSIVYLVNFEKTNYAVKRTKNAMPGPKTRLRKYEEVNILKSLRRFDNENVRENFETDNEKGSDYVLTFIAAWEMQNHLYIMTDFCENGSLDVFLMEESQSSSKRLDEWRVWKIFIEVLMGLKWIHYNNVLHLDIKPANIFITFDGTLKIGDFGVGCKLPIVNKDWFDREGDREYIAPEIISKHEYSIYADIFSVGIMMVEIAAGVILPDNGLSWQKLRSGDLSDAGKLSSSDFNDNLNNKSHFDTKWIPYWFVDGSSLLDKLVKWMINPNPSERPNCNDLLTTYEFGVVELRRKSGATIYEGDYGPFISNEDLIKENNQLLSTGRYKLSDVL